MNTFYFDTMKYNLINLNENIRSSLEETLKNVIPIYI